MVIFAICQKIQGQKNDIDYSELLAWFVSGNKMLDGEARWCRAQNGSKMILLDDENAL